MISFYYKNFLMLTTSVLRILCVHVFIFSDVLSLHQEFTIVSNLNGCFQQFWVQRTEVVVSKNKSSRHPPRVLKYTIQGSVTTTTIRLLVFDSWWLPFRCSSPRSPSSRYSGGNRDTGTRLENYTLSWRSGYFSYSIKDDYL